MTQDDLETFVKLGLLEPTGRTPDGRVTEYRLTHAGRTLATTPSNQPKVNSP